MICLKRQLFTHEFWLSKILTAGLLLLLAFAYASPIYANETCDRLVHELQLDSSYKSIELTFIDGGFMGYEFMKSKPIFTNPDEFREYVNSHSRSIFPELDALEPPVGNIYGNR